jgi:hypothetical protein
MGQGFGGSMPAWMAFKPQTLAQPTYDVVARNYQHYRIPRPAVPEEGGSPPGQICWGVIGDMPTAQPAPTVDFNVKSEEWTEISRESQLVRVENPDDPSQYVMEDRPSRVKFNAQVSGGGKPGPNTSSETPGGLNRYDADQLHGFIPLENDAYQSAMSIEMKYKQSPSGR